MKCGKRQGIELPKTGMADIAIMRCKVLAAMKDCSCGGYVECFTYDGKLDKDRNIV